MTEKTIFWIFGILQSTSLGVVIFLIFRSFNLVHGEQVVGPDTHVLVSAAFPLFLLLVEYAIYSKTGETGHGDGKK